MFEKTALDMAHAAMQAGPDDDAARLRFHERLGDSELFLLLSEEAQGDNITPELFEVADGRFVLAFDREDRLVRFAGRPAPFAGMSGRVLVRMLTGQGIGIGLNLEVAPSAYLMAAEAVEWLDATLGHAPDRIEERIAGISKPQNLPQPLLVALDAKLSTARGLADAAYLIGVEMRGGAHGHLLAFVDALPQAQRTLAKTVSEALTFSGVEAGVLDVGFFAATDPMAAKLAQYGLRFDLPQPDTADTTRPAPGRDPARPPILK